jgi:hypothetical protein
MIWQKELAMANVIKWVFISALGIFVVLQLVAIPTLAQQTNPPIVQEPNWDSEQTRTLARRACFDCHSNETRWPLYSRVAPVTWFITDHVVEGREAVNFSEWGNFNEEAEEFAEVIREGEMPLPNYLPLHAEAQLTSAEQEQLIRGLYATMGMSPRQTNEAEGEHEGYEEHEEYEDDE